MESGYGSHKHGVIWAYSFLPGEPALEIDAEAALVNEDTSRTLFILTVVTVLALPINLIAGPFGMNVGGIPFAGHPHGFFLIVALVALITGELADMALLRRRDR